MKTVFMIAPYFVPRRRVGSLRPYKFAIHLQSFGWKPVICTIEDSGSELTAAEQKALHGIEILPVNPPFDRTAAPPASGSKDKRDSLMKKAGNWLADWFDRQVPMDSWIFLFRSSYGKILEEARSAEPDLIWSTGDPWSGHWLGHKLSQDLKKPWIADFRDPWTLTDLNLRERSRFSAWADRKLESIFIAAADKVIFTSKSAEASYRDYYELDNKKTATLYNSYYPSEPDRDAQEWQSELDPDKLNLLFFGSFRRLSPVQPIANALEKLDDSDKKKIRVHSFGSLDENDSLLLEKLGLTDLFEVHEKVVPGQAASVLDKADLLLVSTSEDRKNIIPAKLWEYLSTEKPILSITPNPEIGEILEKTGAGIHFSNGDSRQIAEFLSNAIQNKLAGKKLIETNRRPDVISGYSSESTTKDLVRIMEDLLEDG